jgi:hypothetical protein
VKVVFFYGNVAVDPYHRYEMPGPQKGPPA